MRSWRACWMGGMVAVAVLGGDTAAVRADVIEIEVRDNRFTPEFVILYLGDTVRWVWVDKGIHDTTAIGGYWDSGLRGQGARFQVTFWDSGQYDYFCTTHIDCCDMVGTLYVLPFRRSKPWRSPVWSPALVP